MTNKNKAIIQRLYKEVLRDWNMKVVDELVSPQFTSHDWPMGSPTGPQAFKDFYSNIMLYVVPDAHYKIDDLIAEEDKVVVRWRMFGTHKGIYNGIPPTGKAIILKGIAIYRLKDNKIMERWVITDLYTLLQETASEVPKQI
ncbi:ester cyclase [Zobellia galactanivorans]|uniref:ester cyclase n=1 Tax=Zobellia galactanivorans (strain DSM 12802 / CCUG 47099 / CIP 106680 / NCIMB 13871 / Dsij) TaxID=63186 RepID=UPI0026E3B113|nr:ester cyclase [Zobellia galactanivorans]MDO6810922.1 ester cyclase [Zobellia galactanivorans]